MFQIMLTPSAGKRLIGKALASHPEIQKVLKTGTLAIIAGTTNAYAAEEILKSINQADGFKKEGFIRGSVQSPVKPPYQKKTPESETGKFPGDVIIINGKWEQGLTIFDAVKNLKCGDIVLKGANCISPDRKKAGILIGHPQAGTIGAVLPLISGSRIRLMIPAGLEKTITEDPDHLAEIMNNPKSNGTRLLSLNGNIFTEIEALELLYGVSAKVAASGGIFGAEGGKWLIIEGISDQEKKAESELEIIAREALYGF